MYAFDSHVCRRLRFGGGGVGETFPDLVPDECCGTARKGSAASNGRRYGAHHQQITIEYTRRGNSDEKGDCVRDPAPETLTCCINTTRATQFPTTSHNCTCPENMDALLAASDCPPEELAVLTDLFGTHRVLVCRREGGCDRLITVGHT